MGGVAITSFMFWCGAAVIVRSRPGRRPDAWLAATGFLVGAVGRGAAAALPGLRPDDLLPTTSRPRASPAFALVGGAAAVRLRLGPARTATGRRSARVGPNASLAGAVAFTVAIVSVAVDVRRDPAAVLPFLLLTGVFRGLRVWVTERENARLVGSPRASRAELADQYRATLMALGATLEARDGYTGGHGEETVELVAAVAARLGLPTRQIDEVRRSRCCTTSARSACPTRSCSSPARSTTTSGRIMREHPVIGERILRPVPGLVRVAAPCATSTSAGTAAAIRTGSPARRSRSPPASCSSATPSTR